jgi:formylglycine-generating enzyme required for sulfatase activity
MKYGIKIIIPLTAFLLLAFTSFAQNPEFKVKAFSHEQNSMLARIKTNLRLDDNDEACALILVRTAETGLGFTANTGIVGTADWKKGDYWVYVSEGARSIKIFKQGIKTIEYLFEIIPKSRETYLLELEVIRPKLEIPIFPVTIRYTPTNALLSIDGKAAIASSTHNLTFGEHSIQLTKDGYQPISKTISVDDKNVFFEWTLEKAQTQWLVITSNPDGADVYIDDQAVGKTPYQNELQVGKYKWRLQKELYLIQEGVVELNASTPRQTVEVTLKADYGTLTISTEPEVNAEVYINGMSINKSTPCKIDKVPSGEKTIKAIKNLYQITEQSVTVSPESNLNVTLNSNPTFGNISVNSAPESGATVSLDGMPTGKTTPCSIEKVPAGEHTVTVSLEMYETSSGRLNLIAGETKPMTIEMNPTFAGISVSSEPKADIYINDQFKANGLWQGRLNPGVYTFEGRLEKHRTAIEKQTVSVGVPLQIKLIPEPIIGTLKVMSNPFNATLTINGKSYGTTPITINDLLIGSYNIKIEKQEHSSVIKTIEVLENQTTILNETLSTGKQVTITSNPTGAQLSIDNEPVGLTPKNLTLGIGSHNIRLVKGKKVVEESISIKDGSQASFSFDVSEISNFTESSSGVPFEMIAVKGGTFTMGSPDNEVNRVSDETQHKVSISDFLIGKHEVTQKQWTQIMGSNPSKIKRDNLPVERVSWNDIQEFIIKLNQKTGINYRLPTEAEWEYAARGGNQSRGYTYSGSNTIDEVAWYSVNSSSKTHPFGTKKANELGIYDMSGNVWEWCNDRYNAEYYKNSPKHNPQGSSSGNDRGYRGGSWNFVAQYCRVAYRNGIFPDYSYHDLGFRLALSSK